MTPNRGVFKTFQFSKELGNVHLADNRTIPIVGYGTILYKFDGFEREIRNALYVPELSEVLSSISSFIEGTDDSVVFDAKGVMLYLSNSGKEIKIGSCIGDLYYLQTSDASNVNTNSDFHTQKGRRAKPFSFLVSDELNDTPDSNIVEPSPEDEPGTLDDDIHSIGRDMNLLIVRNSYLTKPIRKTLNNRQTHTDLIQNRSQSMSMVELVELHRKFGHISLSSIINTLNCVCNVSIVLDKDAQSLLKQSILENCLICAQNKFAQLPIGRTSHPAMRKLFRIHADLVKLPVTHVGMQYWLIIVDEFS